MAAVATLTRASELLRACPRESPRFLASRSDGPSIAGTPTRVAAPRNRKPAPHLPGHVTGPDMSSPILNYATAIDQTLRGDHTTPQKLATGKISIPVRKLITGSLVLGVLYGIAMGLYGGMRASEGGGLQVLSTMVKVPSLFLLTLAVTYPSLYVFSTLTGSRMSAVGTRIQGSTKRTGKNTAALGRAMMAKPVASPLKFQTLI